MQNSVNGRLNYIGKEAFAYNNLKEIVIPATLTIIESSSFERNQIKELFIPTITSIEEFAFKDNKITTLIFEDTEESPSKLTTLRTEAFKNNNIQGKVVLPASITRIESQVFYNNPDLTEIIIKRENSDEINTNSAWNGTATVTYNPNYSE